MRNPRCGVFFTALNKSTGRQYTTKLQARLMLHLIERIEMETVGKVMPAQLHRSERYAWKLAPLYRAELTEKIGGGGVRALADGVCVRSLVV